MKQRSKHRAKAHACPHCGRFYFMPCEGMLGMRHIHMSRGRNSGLPEAGVHTTKQAGK